MSRSTEVKRSKISNSFYGCPIWPIGRGVSEKLFATFFEVVGSISQGQQRSKCCWKFQNHFKFRNFKFGQLIEKTQIKCCNFFGGHWDKRSRSWEVNIHKFQKVHIIFSCKCYMKRKSEYHDKERLTYIGPKQ